MPNEYALPAQRPNFSQIEPTSSYWFRCPILCIVSFDDIRNEVDDVVAQYPTDSNTLDEEIAELRNFYNRREQPFTPAEVGDLSLFLKNPLFTAQQPIGAVVSRRPNFSPLLSNGKELATLFENETPGLWHRHILNVLFDPTIPMGLGQKLSPPLQALIWSALDVAIASALMAAWHYKWLATGKGTVARRQRPFEYANTPKNPFEVLFDLRMEPITAANPIIRRVNAKTEPMPSPGTPRHPAYPSGHSTYAAAASTVLGCFFDKIETPELNDLKVEFDKLARNIGEARLWGGVHWRSDDDTGREIGNAIGRNIIGQLNQTGIYKLLDPKFELSDVERTKLEGEAEDFAAKCTDEKGEESDFCQGLPKAAQKEVLQNVLGK